MKLKTASLLGIFAAISCLPAAFAEKAGDVPPDAPQPADGQAKVQLAILLDTSGSMSGLIDQAKTQLWQIVNTFISAKQNGRTPFVEVALYEYGNSGLDETTHFIRQIEPLTRDLDKVSDHLFKLTTNGGQEYCGAVIRRALDDLAWDASPGVYKAIFVAGNEPFTQGPINASDTCRSAIAKGVIVNTIHCGAEQVGVDTGWKSGAMLADGKFLIIDQNKAVVHVDAPQDPEIVKLNTLLNATYISYGARAAEGKALQVSQDANAIANASAGSAVNRIASKASVNYCNGSWDLVDACAQKDFDLSKVADAELPPELKGKTLDEKRSWIEQKKSERASIQKQILDLNKQREAYVADKLKDKKGNAGDTLDAVVTSAVRDQAKTKGFAFDSK
jgi:hypothetical protein